MNSAAGEPSAATERSERDGIVEAVVLTGPRRGEIVCVDLEHQEVWTEVEVALVHDALRELNAALDGVRGNRRRLKASSERVLRYAEEKARQGRGSNAG